jgi:hypothetical protein
VASTGHIVDEPGNGLIELFALPTDQDNLLRLLEKVFEHWQVVQFGPIIQGAAYEIKAPCAPRITVLDGYATLDFEQWHMHICVGPTIGDPSNPTAPEVAAIRPCQRAELYRLIRQDAPVSWGLRLYNGAEEQLLTVLLPNPFLDDNDMPCEPNWERLALWDDLRDEFLNIAPDSFDRSGLQFVHG